MTSASGNQWTLPVVILVMIVVLTVAFGGAAIALGGPSQPSTSVLKVPGNYRTIQAGIDAAKPGDIIQVAPGTYNENITIDKAVSLTAETFDQINPTNNTTILDGRGQEATVQIAEGLSQMPALYGFVIRNSKNGIQASSEFTAENNFFYGSTVSVHYQIGSGGVNRGNLYFNSGDDAIHLDNMSRPLLIENNRIMYAGDDAIEVGLPSDSVPTSPVEVDIWNNMLIGSREDGIKFVDAATNTLDANRRFVIVSNLLANNRRAGIGMMSNTNTNEDYSGADTAEAVRVYNNTFYGNDYGISGGDNLVAFNNIIANTASRGAWRVQGGSAANSVIADSLFFGNRVDTDQTTLGPGDIFGQDPLFLTAPSPGPDGSWGTVDDDFGGLLLQQGSPAIDKGVTQFGSNDGEAVPPTPIAGFAGAAPDLGWREYGSPIFITPTAVGTALPTASITMTVAASATPAASQTSIPGASTTPLPTSSTPASGSPTPETTTTPVTSTPAGSPTVAATGTEANSGVGIQSIAPANAKVNTVVTMTIKGSGFQDGATVSFQGLSEPAPQVSGIQLVDSGTLVIVVDAIDNDPETEGEADHDTDVWNLRVINPDGSTAVLMNAFTINP
ncbi:MAG: hypothetical protein ACXWNQ_02375 [Anaerolineales bacterium]